MTVSFGKCKLCMGVKDLVDSHALPDSAYRALFHDGDGKVILLSNKLDTPTQYTSDSGGTFLFCADCEKKLNERYDQYGIGVFKGIKTKVTRSDTGITFSGLDHQRFRMFFVSLVWRMEISQHKYFGAVEFPVALRNQFHQHIRNNTILPRSRMRVALYRLRNTINVEGFSHEELRNPVVAPFITRHNSILFVFYGFAIECFLLKMKSKHSNNKSILGNTGSVYFSPYTEIFGIPEILEVFKASFQREQDGNTKIS